MGVSFRAHAIVTMPELIKTRNGKLVRRLARQAWLAEAAGDLSAVESPAVFDRVSARCSEFRRAAAERAELRDDGPSTGLSSRNIK